EIVATARQVANLVLQPCFRRLLGAAPFFQAGEVGAKRRVLLGRRLQLLLELLEMPASRLQRLFLHPPQRVLFFYQRRVALLLFDRALALFAEALHLGLRDVEPLGRAAVLFLVLAQLVIQRERFFLLRLLRRAEPLQFFAEPRDAGLDT